MNDMELHPHEGRTLYPYAKDLSLHVVRRDWFEAYEALLTYEPEFAFHPNLRFVLNAVAPIRLRVTAPLLDRPLGARGRWWKPILEGDSSIGVWIRCCRSISSHPRRTDAEVEEAIQLASEW